MPNQRAAQVRDMSDEMLVDRLAETKAELFNLRFQHVTGQLDNYSRLPQLKREIARIHTELRTREIAAAEALESQP
ncbi:MAG: 50S ribosomal protein L29 [Actinobacteria bacterium]|nr:50S ribosomal protein L29 [Actinomycetota bacterium]